MAAFSVKKLFIFTIKVNNLPDVAVNVISVGDDSGSINYDVDDSSDAIIKVNLIVT